jgi:hypothetical protein
MTIAWGGERGAGGSGAVLGGEGGVIPLTIANHEPSDAEIAEIEARKAELQEQKERERRRGGRVLSEKFIRRDQPGEPTATAEVARSAIREFKRATGAKRDTRRQDADALVRIAIEHPDASQPRLKELYREETGRSITEMTVRKILREAGLPTVRGPQGRPAGQSRREKAAVSPEQFDPAPVVVESSVLEPKSNRGRPLDATYRGVHPDGADPKKPFRAVLRIAKGKTQWLGRFETAVEAAQAWDDAAFARFGELARLNFPDRVPMAGVATVEVEVERRIPVRPSALPAPEPTPEPAPVPEKPWQRQVNAVYAMCEILEKLQPKEREWVVYQACFMFGFSVDMEVLKQGCGTDDEGRAEG